MTVDAVGNINYLTSTTDGLSPWLIEHSVPATVRSNFVQTPVPVKFHDLRDRENTVNIDINGLEVIKYNGSVQEEFEDGSEAQKKHYEEVIDLLKKRLGASRVHIFHHTFRYRSAPLPDEKLDHTHRNPVFYPHVDADLQAVRETIDRELDAEESAQRKKKRFQLINIWRPVGDDPITTKPLTICDYQSIDINKDIRPLVIRGACHNYSSYTLSRNENDAHVWYYLSQMRSDEMLMFKISDSKPDVAQYAFHTAVTIQDAPITNGSQRSLEFRCLVFYDE